jgi:hypothetical protein
MSVVKSLIVADDQQSSDAISVYPNPAKNRLYFICEDKDLHITIFAVDGATVMEQDISEATLDISQLHSGLYYLQVRSPEAEQGFKLIKQ